MCPHHMCNCVQSATLVAIDETNIVAVDLTNVCESHDCSLVFSGHWTHAHHQGLSRWLSKQQEVVEGMRMCMMFR